MKPEWYANDHLYLKEHPDNSAFRRFCGISEYQVTCLPYYKQDYVERQIHNIQQFYLHPPEYSADFHYLTPAMMQNWVERAAALIIEQLVKLGC